MVEMDLEAERERIERLAGDLLLRIRQDLAGPVDPVNVFVVLNALAICTSIVLGGTGFALQAINFFHQVLTEQMRDLADNENAGHA